MNFVAKVFEKLMCNRLTKYLDTNKLLSNNQFGFKAGLCTSDALAEFTDNIYEALNRKEKLIGIYLDFSKAFDTVNIDILLAKLSHLGIKH